MTTNDSGSIIFCLDISGSMDSRQKLYTVKQVLLARLEDLHKNHPGKKLGLVLFGGDIRVCVGDVTKEGILTAAKNAISDVFSSKKKVAKKKAAPVKNRAPPMQ